MRSEGLYVALSSAPSLRSLAKTIRLRQQQRVSCRWPQRHQHCLGIYAITSNDFRPGVSIEFDGSPWRVQEFMHVKPGKGAAFVRTKLRNYITGNTIDKTFRAGETVEEARVEKDVKQYTYKDADQYVFMDMVTYEESRLNEADLGDKQKWLKEGMECNVLAWNGRVIDVELPMIVKLQVAQTDPGLKGDTAQGGTKPATLDTGAVVTSPIVCKHRRCDPRGYKDSDLHEPCIVQGQLCQCVFVC